MLSIDSQSVKAGPFVSEEKGIDGNKKVNGRKRHIITDTLGLIWGGRRPCRKQGRWGNRTIGGGTVAWLLMEDGKNFSGCCL